MTVPGFAGHCEIDFVDLAEVSSWMLPSPEHIPGGYRRDPSHTGLVIDRDVYVPMRDGVRLCVDVHRPDTDEPLPALLAFAIYNKEIQTPEATAALPPQPAWSPLWTGPQEAGDTRFLVARGYVHVIGMPRGVGKSEGGGSREFDSYDLIEWIAQQPWCDGNVGMIGISGFGAEQVHVARQQPAAPQGDLPVRPARRLRHARRLPRGVPGRRAAPVPLPRGALRRVPPGPRRARRAAAGEGGAVAGGDGRTPTTGCTRTSTTSSR